MEQNATRFLNSVYNGMHVMSTPAPFPWSDSHAPKFLSDKLYNKFIPVHRIWNKQTTVTVGPLLKDTSNKRTSNYGASNFSI